MRAARGERNELSYATRPQHVMRNDPELMSYAVDVRDQLPGRRDACTQRNQVFAAVEARMQMRWAASVVPGR